MGSITDTAVATSEAVKLPVINISQPTLEVGKQMVDAAVKYGFLYIDPQGTGFTKEIVNQMFQWSQQFFASPDEQKSQCKMTSVNRGWSGMHSETLDPKTQRQGDFKEAIDFGEFNEHGQPQQPMPWNMEDHISEISAFQNLCRITTLKILDLLALGLEVEDPLFFSRRHTLPSGTAMRLLHYPSIAEDIDYRPEVDIRAGAHSDYGSVTLLFQHLGQPGLEIRTPEDQWAPVLVMPQGYHGDFPPILVNIADLLSYWTNGLLKSTVHRVIFPADARKGGEDRYSIVYFAHPAHDTELVPVPSRIVQAMKPIEDGVEVGYGGGAANKRALTAEDHLRNRLEATYGIKMESAGKKTT